jgi:hypothetical protein
MIKPWVPHSYNRCSKQPPSISRQNAVHHMEFSPTCLNMLAKAAVTAAWKSCQWDLRYSGSSCINVLLPVPSKEKIQQNPIWQPRRPYNSPSMSNPPSLISHVTLLPNIFLIVYWTSVVLKPQSLSHSYRHNFQAAPVEQFPENQHPWWVTPHTADAPEYVCGITVGLIPDWGFISVYFILLIILETNCICLCRNSFFNY